jgi:Excalibur calcium-binding domain
MASGRHFTDDVIEDCVRHFPGVARLLPGRPLLYVEVEPSNASSGHTRRRRPGSGREKNERSDAWHNCEAVNARYPHGVGRVGARDHTSGTPVTTFKHSSSLYRTAMSYNRALDRDRDGIACEEA